MDDGGGGDDELCLLLACVVNKSNRKTWFLCTKMDGGGINLY
jgi:hypothetical protein